MGRIFKGLATICAAATIAGAAHATNPDDEALVCAVAATVNDEVITTYELQQRVNLLVNTSGARFEDEDLEALRRQILDGMIDEKLQLQEIRRFEQSIPREEVESYLTRMAASNQLSLGEFLGGLREIDVDPATLFTQVEAEIAWMRLVNGLFGERAEVAEAELDLEMSRIETAMSKTQFLLSEIYLDVPSPRERAAVAGNARRIFDQIRNGASFPALARQFSALPSAARGGDVDWITADAMPEEVANVLRESQAGVLLSPIETATGFYVIAVRDVRHSMQVVNTDAIVDAVQVVHRLAPDASADAVEDARASLNAIDLGADGCAAARAHGDADPVAIAVSLEGLALSDMLDVFRAALAPLKAGEASPALRAAGGLHRLFLCAREDIENEAPEMKMPSRDVVTRDMEDRKLGLFAQRYLRDLRRDANIEILI